MTTVYPFVPTSVAPFQFQPTLDGNVYSITVVWNIQGRWYVQVTDLAGNPIAMLPAIASLPVANIEAMTWRNGRITVTTEQPHGYRIGQTLDLTIAGCVPTALNGVLRCFVTGSKTFVYQLATNPGTPKTLGTYAYDINILAGYFASRLVYRESADAFEVSP